MAGNVTLNRIADSMLHFGEKKEDDAPPSATERPFRAGHHRDASYFFRQEERRHNLEQFIANINRLIAFFETRQEPVIHAITSYRADGSDWDLKLRAAGTPLPHTGRGKRS